MDNSSSFDSSWSSIPGEDEMASHSRQSYQIAITTVILALCIPSVVLRIWVRKWMINSLGSDDVMMIIALVAFVMYNAALMAIVANGGGTHIRGLEEIRVAMDWTVINECFYLLTQIFLKLSLGLFFLRVVIKKGQRKFIWATITLATIINLYHIFFVIFRCGDPRRYAESQILGKCVNNKIAVALAYEQAAVSTVTDIIFAAMPIPLLWNAAMDLRSKISAGFILSLGAFGSICSIVRFLYVQNLAYGEDFFWSAVNISIWSTIELGTGIIAGSLATMRPLLKKLVRSTKQHITHHTRQERRRPSTGKTSFSKPPPIIDNIESLPSVFRPWESVGESGGYTTTCVGGSQIEKELKMSASNSKNRSIDLLSSVDYSNRAAIWPFVEDAGGIAKVVDVQVSVTESTTLFDVERQAPDRPQGGGLWGVRMEDRIRKPSSRSGGNGNVLGHSRTSTPEWDRLPDLVPLEEIVSRRSSEQTEIGVASVLPPPTPPTPPKTRPSR